MSANNMFRKLRMASLRLREILWSFGCYDPKKSRVVFTRAGYLFIRPFMEVISPHVWPPVGGQPCGDFHSWCKFLSVTEVAPRSNHLLGGGFIKHFLMFTLTWEIWPNWRTYFSTGLVQPPTSLRICCSGEIFLYGFYHPKSSFGRICLYFFRALNKQIQVIFIT